MTLRLVPSTFTFEQQRQQINFLANDVGDLDYILTPSNNLVDSVNDVIAGNVTLSGQTAGYDDGSRLSPTWYFDSSPSSGFYKYDNTTIGISKNLYIYDTLTVDGTVVLNGSVNIYEDLNVVGNTTISGYLLVGGDITFRAGTGGSITLGDQNSDNVIFGADVNSNIIPNINNFYNLGSSSQQWGVLYTDEITTASGIANLYNTTTTTVNAFGAATSVTIGSTTGTTTIRNTNTVVTGDLAVNGGDISSSSLVFNLANSSTTVNAFNSASLITLGTTSGTTNVRNNLDVDGDVNIDGGDLTVSTAAFNLANTTATTVNAFGAATAINLGASTGTTTVKNNLHVVGNTTVSGTLIVEGDVTFKSGASGSVTLGDQNTDNVVFGADINSNIIPNTDNAYDLGSTTQEWRDIYIDGIAQIDTLQIDESATITGDLAVNGGDITTTSGSFNLLNQPTSVTAFSAATAVNIGAATGTTNVKNNLDVDGDVNIDGGDLTVSTASFNLANTTATTVNAFGAGTSVNIGAATGTTNIKNNLDVDGDVNIDGGDLTVSTSTFNLADTTASTVNAFGASTNLNIGATTGTLTLRNPELVGTSNTQNLYNTVATTVNAFGAATFVNIGANTGTTDIKHDLNVSGQNLSTNQTNFNLLNTSVNTLFAFGSATNINIGASTGDTTIRNNLRVERDLNISGGDLTANTIDFNLINDTVKTVNAFGAAFDVYIASVSGTTNIRNQLKVDGGTINVTNQDTSIVVGANKSTPFVIKSPTEPYFYITTTTGSESITLTKNTRVNGSLTVDGDITFRAGAGSGGSLTFGDINTDNIVLNADLNSNIIPNSSNTFDLGSPTQKWRNLYLESGIFTGGTGTFTDVIINGDLAVNGGDITSTASTFQLLSNTGINEIDFGTYTPSVYIGSRFSGTTYINNDLFIFGDLIISGVTTQIDTQVLTVSDPIIDLGTAVTSGVPTQDPYNRGIRFYYIKDGVVKQGFFGYNQSNGKFSYIPDATEVAPFEFDGQVGVLHVSGITGYATRLQTPRSISLAGDVVGTVLFDGTSDVTISGTIQPLSVELGVDTEGQYAETITLSGLGLALTLPEISGATNYVLQSSATSSNTANTLVYRDENGDFLANVIGATLSGNAFTASRLQTLREIKLIGDISGNVLFDGSQNVEINTDIQPNSVNLGQDTIGKYAQSVTISGLGFNITPANIEDGTEYIIDSSATNLNVADTLVYRDENGDFSANIITATLSGTATNVSQPLVAGAGISFSSGSAYNGSQYIVISTTQDVGTGSNVQFNDLTITGDLTVNGTTTTLNSTTVTIDDKNIELGSIKDAFNNYQVSDITADGGGITLKGDTDKTITWLNSNDSWNFSESIIVASGKAYKIEGVDDVLTSTSLGISVVNSNLQTLGELNSLTVKGQSNLGTENGSVGINTSNPTQKLDVNGNVRIRGGLYDSTNTVGEEGKFLSTTASGVQWRTLEVANLLWVTKDGDDTNDGLSQFTAKATIKSALEVAESLILPADSGIRSDAAVILDFNRDFIRNEAYGYITEKYPDLLGIGNLPEEANRYQDASNLIIANKEEILDRSIAEIAVQYNESTWGTDWVIPGDTITTERSRYFDSYRLIQQNRSEIVSGAFAVISGFTANPNPSKCQRDIGYFVDAISLDLFLGGNKYARKFTLQYFNNGALTEVGLVGETAQSVIAFNQARDLMKSAINNQLTIKDLTLTADPVTGSNTSVNSCANVRTTIDTLTSIVTTSLSSESIANLPRLNSGSFDVGSSVCYRDLGLIVNAVASDLEVGGNANIIEAAYSYFSGSTLTHIDGEQQQSVVAFNKARDMMKLAITNQLYVKNLDLIPDPLTDSNIDPLSCANVKTTIDNLVSILTTAVSSGDISTVSSLTVNDGIWFKRDITKCARDLGYVVNAYIDDLRNGGNVSSVEAGERYYDGSGLNYVDGQVEETVEAFEYVRNLSIAAMRNWDYQLQNCNIVNNSSTVTVPTTVGMVVGMKVTGAGIPADTYVKDIVNANSFELGNISRTLSVQATSTATVTLTFDMEMGIWASGLTPTTISGVIVDVNYPECAGVETAIITYTNIINNIVQNGVGSVQRVWPNAGLRINVSTGTYTEQNPMRVPTNVAIHGDNLRSVNVIPANPTEDIFHVFNGSYITGMTFQGHQFPSAAVAFPPEGAGLITKSPYVQNCTSITTTGCGMRVDGQYAGGTKSMVLDSYTQYNQGGDGIVILNGGYAQLVSIFEICCDRAVYVSGGSTCSITNSNTDFGNYGLVSDGVSLRQYTAQIDGDGQSGNIFNLKNIGVNKPYVGQVATFGRLYFNVQRIKILNGGSGYTARPTVTISLPTGPNGIPAQATANIEGGVVTSIDVLTSGSQFEYAPEITISSSPTGDTATAEVEVYPVYYTINSATEPVNGECTIVLEENLPWVPDDNDLVEFFQVSRIIASSHCFEYVGSGTNINTALPSLGGVPIQENEVVTLNGGRVAVTSTDHLGNFRIGSDLVINQNTGTLSGRTFSKSLFAELTPFILALQ